ncbi:MAG TPA: cupin domain-containing protein [Longimicrobiales bacterium]|nr:cupin domain-containing protein [Longimicrobiales bacterium]
MPSIERPLSGDVLVIDLAEERARTANPEMLARSGRSARTLIKTGPLRLTLISLAAGGEIAEHEADGPITVQPLEGRIRFSVPGAVHELGPGELLSLAPRVRHAVASEEGATILLTVAAPTG